MMIYFVLADEYVFKKSEKAAKTGQNYVEGWEIRRLDVQESTSKLPKYCRWKNDTKMPVFGKVLSFLSASHRD